MGRRLASNAVSDSAGRSCIGSHDMLRASQQIKYQTSKHRDQKASGIPSQ